MELNCAKIICYVILFEKRYFRGNLTRRIWLEYFQSYMTSSSYRFLIGGIKVWIWTQIWAIIFIESRVEELFIHLCCGKFKFWCEFNRKHYSSSKKNSCCEQYNRMSRTGERKLRACRAGRTDQCTHIHPGRLACTPLLCLLYPLSGDCGSWPKKVQNYSQI